MRFGKLKMFLLLQGLAIFILLSYFGVWMISEKTVGRVVRPFGSTLNVTYTANSQTFNTTHARYDVPYGETKVVGTVSFIPPFFFKDKFFYGPAGRTTRLVVRLFACFRHAFTYEQHGFFKRHHLPIAKKISMAVDGRIFS